MTVKPLTTLDIVLSVYNQEKIISMILDGIFKNTVTPFTLIMVFDGCTDNTRKIVLDYIEKKQFPTLKKFVEIETPNVYETKANNAGFRLSKADYLITLQDDMLILEPGWEIRLTYPLRKYNDVFAVTARIAQDIKRTDSRQPIYFHRAGRELAAAGRSTFAVRDIINRGPIAFRSDFLRKLDYLDEAFAPSDLDDADISLRAWKDYTWKVGAFWIDYLSEKAWSKTKAPDSSMGKMLTQSVLKNTNLLQKLHGDYFASGMKHDENIYIPDKEIDYPISFDRYALKKNIATSQFRYMMKVYPILFRKKTEGFLRNSIYVIFEGFGFKEVHERGIRYSVKNRFKN